jgi:hypothetical protein
LFIFTHNFLQNFAVKPDFFDEYILLYRPADGFVEYIGHICLPTGFFDRILLLSQAVIISSGFRRAAVWRQLEGKKIRAIRLSRHQIALFNEYPEVSLYNLLFFVLL